VPYEATTSEQATGLFCMHHEFGSVDDRVDRQINVMCFGCLGDFAYDMDHVSFSFLLIYRHLYSVLITAVDYKSSNIKSG